MRKVLSVIAGLCLLGAAAAQAAESTLSVSSTAVPNQGTMPTIYTCDGQNINPEIGWSGVSNKAQAFALIMSDPDAPRGTYYHWILYNIPKDTKSLAENGSLPAGTLAGTNSEGKMEYKGPCPPKGAPHHYIFTLYALDSDLKLAPGADEQTVMDDVKKHVVQQGKFTAMYSRS